MIPKTKQHIHRYQRMPFSKRMNKTDEYIIYRCMKLGCNHYIDARLILNKPTLCHNCDREIVIDQRMISTKIVKPICVFCSEDKKRDQEMKKELKKKGEMETII